uniref:Uncharacterized protein n=1 Tax=Arundo donax TaxID=35708 RepID=A0A0A8ZVP2_ARUDO
MLLITLVQRDVKFTFLTPRLATTTQVSIRVWRRFSLACMMELSIRLLGERRGRPDCLSRKLF